MRIALCIPHYGDTKGLFTGSLAELLIGTCKVGVPTGSGLVIPELAVFMVSGALVAVNRERIARQALAAESDYLFWLDADMSFPADALGRLMMHMQKTEVVGCNYPRRTSPTGPVALRINNGAPEPVYTTADKAERRIVEQVDVLGFGVCLMSAKVFGMIEQPWFAVEPDCGEDGYFFRKLRQAGVRPFVDHQLSRQIGHIGERVFTNDDAEADRERWKLPNLYD